MPGQEIVLKCVSQQFPPSSSSVLYSPTAAPPFPHPPHQPCVFSQSENAWNFNKGGGRAVGRDLSGILAQPLRGLRLRRAAALHIFPLKTI